MEPVFSDTSLQQGIIQLPLPISILIAALTGIFCKLYDDAIDLKIYKDGDTIPEIIKVCITCFTTLMASSNIFASIFILILSFVELACASADTPYWKMGILIPITTTILHCITLPILQYSSIFIIINIIAIIVCLLAVYFEKKMFSEEMSINKINNRTICVITSIYSIYAYYNSFSYFPIIPIILSWVSGYMGTYVIDHLAYRHIFQVGSINTVFQSTKESHSD
jgi:hypothetical protein